MNRGERLILSSALAALLAAGPLNRLTEDRWFWVIAAGLCLSSAGLSILVTRRGGSVEVGRLMGLLPGAALLVTQLPHLAELMAQTIDFIQQSLAPMPPHYGFRLFSAILIWVLYLAVEAIAHGFDHPAATLPVLASAYLATVVALPDSTSPWWFAPVAVSYLMVLGTAAPPPDGGRLRSTLATASVGAVAFGLSMAIIQLAPHHEAGWIQGETEAVVQLGDPSQDLIRNIRRPADREVLQYRTSDGAGRYLRLTALPELSDNGFGITGTDLTTLPGPEPPSGGDELLQTLVQVDNFASEYLPTPANPRTVEPAEDWRYDPQTSSLVSIGSGRASATQGLSYTVTSYAAEPTRAEISDADAGDPRDDGLTRRTQPEASSWLSAIALQVIGEADRDGAKALALLDWFHSGAFTYSLESQSGDTLSTLEDFLLGSRTGYCEQFAGALAVLAREVGIPSRVVVGFLPGTRDGDWWRVSLRQMHAWTEVYLADLGWVALDPTPSGSLSGRTPSTSATPSTTPSPDRTSSSPEVSMSPSPDRTEIGSSQVSTTSPVTSGVGLGIAAGIAAFALPGLCRFVQRRYRLGHRDPVRFATAVWQEALAQVVDAGGRWPEGTPHSVAERLTVEYPSAGPALAALADEVDRARYSPDHVLNRTILQQYLREISAALPAVPLWRRWLPRSLWRRR